VEDSGIGIDAKKIDVIFERFRQTDDSLSRNYEGAGLGLYISKCYIDLLGGKIWAENNPDKGAVFCFKIPLIKPMKLKRNPYCKQEFFEPQKLKILVAEDDSISLKFISKILKYLEIIY
jgi:hypothetical protein